MGYFVQIGINAVVGLLLQLIVSLLLCSAFLAERGRRGGGATYLAYWNGAWLAQAVAVAALTVRFVLLPNLDIQHIVEAERGAFLLHAAYASGKMLFWACLTCGCAAFLRPRTNQAALWFLLVAGQAYGVVVMAATANLDDLALGVYPLAVMASVCCAVAVSRGADGPRTAAGLCLAGVFVANACLTAGLAWYRVIPGPPQGRWLVNNNSYLDCVVHLGLGITMLWAARGARAHAPQAMPTPARI